MGLPLSLLPELLAAGATDTTPTHRPTADLPPGREKVARTEIGREIAITAFRLPMPPSTNGLYTRGRGHGKRIPSRQYRAWLKKALPILRRVAPVQAYPVAISLVVEGRLPATADIDNRVKAVLDAMKKGGVLTDDNRTLVTEVSIQYRPTVGGDGVGVEVRTQQG